MNGQFIHCVYRRSRVKFPDYPKTVTYKLPHLCTFPKVLATPQLEFSTKSFGSISQCFLIKSAIQEFLPRSSGYSLKEKKGEKS